VQATRQTKKVLIIDNYDSFTYILKQYFGELGGNPEVFFHDKITVNQIKRMKPTHIVLSPGPGTVEHKNDVGIMLDVIREFYNKIPILGVCLGHQAIGKFFGAKIVRAPKIMHGKRSKIYHNREGILKGLKDPFDAMRYHSLALQFPISNDPIPPMESVTLRSLRTNPQSPIVITAQSDDKVIMGIQHKQYPVFGVQFHPESLGTPEGKKIINNFLKY
jgi:anthranilate synthase/aminodeoxychorismate synthase-like glutamine amidotransferase